jgi:hypothetical protein
MAQLVLLVLAALGNAEDVPVINAVDETWLRLDERARLAAGAFPRYEPPPLPFFPDGEFSYPRNNALLELTKGSIFQIYILREPFPGYTIRKFSGKPGLLINQPSIAIKLDPVSWLLKRVLPLTCINTSHLEHVCI